MMGTKTISLTDDAYHRLKRMKQPGESFSEVVQRLTGRTDLTKYVGSISPEFADELDEASREVRRRLDEEIAARGH